MSMAIFSNAVLLNMSCCCRHDDVIKWKHFPGFWPFVKGIHCSMMHPYPQKDNDARLWCFFCCEPVEIPVIRNAMVVMRRHRNILEIFLIQRHSVATANDNSVLMHLIIWYNIFAKALFRQRDFWRLNPKSVKLEYIKQHFLNGLTHLISFWNHVCW